MRGGLEDENWDKIGNCGIFWGFYCGGVDLVCIELVGFGYCWLCLVNFVELVWLWVRIVCN